MLLIFRTFEKVSYGLITDTNRQVRAGDVLVSPDAEAIDASVTPELEGEAQEKPNSKKLLPRFLRVFGR